MFTIITGVLILLIGVGNLITGRLHPERINARLQRGMGYVGIALGLAITINGVILSLRPPQ